MNASLDWFVYLLECADGTFYTGITTDLDRRVAEHNTSNKGAKYTRGRRPVRCVYSVTAKNRSEASKAEIKIKKLSRDQKLALIKNS